MTAGGYVRPEIYNTHIYVSGQTLPTPNRILNNRKGKFEMFTIYKQNSC